MSDLHDPEMLASYVIGLLDGENTRAMAAHLAECEPCRQELAQLREVDRTLREVPPEWFLPGPPRDGTLALQRALQQVRQERGARRWRRNRALATAAAMVVLVGVGAAGVALGRATDSQMATAGSTEGERTLTGSDPTTGARMTVTLTPAQGWVRVKAVVMGVAQGEHCQLVVVDRGGHPSIAGSWVFSPTEEEQEYGIIGAAAVAPKDVAAITLQTFAGRVLVTTPA